MRILLFILSLYLTKFAFCLNETFINNKVINPDHDLKNEFAQKFNVSSFSLAISTVQPNTSSFIYWSVEKKDISENTVFPIASLTKMITADIVNKLINKGKINSNDKLEKWFGKDFQWKENTIDQLVNQNSKIPNYTNNDLFWKKRYENLSKIWKPEELLIFSKNMPSRNVPWSYSNTNYILLGMILEKEEKKSLNTIFSDYFKENKMGNSFYGGDSLIDKQPLSYSQQDEIRFINASWLNSAGGVFSTPKEILFQGKKIINNLILSKTHWISTQTGQETLNEEETAYSNGIFRMNSPYGQLFYIPGLLPGFTSGLVYSTCAQISFAFSANRSQIPHFFEYIIQKEFNSIYKIDKNKKENANMNIKDKLCHIIKPSQDFQFANMN
jgi:D-alanyl-D-alanine carboxypeptidase